MATLKANILLKLGLLLPSLLTSSIAVAGWLIAPAVQYRTSALVPVAEEATPNYYAYGLGLNAGYSLGRILDLSAYSRYAPSRLYSAKLGAEALQLSAYGIELGIRIEHLLYLGLRAGKQSYRSFQHRRADELFGQWQGTVWGFSLGVITKITKHHFSQLSLEIDQGPLNVKTEDGESGLRQLSSIAFSAAYVFNSRDEFDWQEWF